MRAQEEREFEFDHDDFNHLRELVKRTTGIKLADSKYNLVYGRVSRRLRALKLSSFRQYRSHLEKPGSNELPELTNAITTNLTGFFREKHHFDRLKSDILPELMDRHDIDRRLRVWSAGCSTGEEPYSIAMTLKEEITDKWGDVRVLATDLDTNVVAHGKAGLYDEKRFENMSPAVQKRWFKRAGEESHQASPRLQELITFKSLNLLHQWPMAGPFDIIFCRNVVIYFDQDTQRELFDRYADLLAPNGYLFIGHSESLFKVCERFESIGNTIYRKLD